MEEVPDDLADLEHQVHDNLVEGIVVADDDLMERYLEGDTLTVAELEHTLARGVADATVFPVVCGSALTGVGVDRLADFLCEIGPSPADRPGVTVTRRRHARSTSRPDSAVSRWRSCSRRSPTPTSASCRCSRCCRAR